MIGIRQPLFGSLAKQSSFSNGSCFVLVSDEGIIKAKKHVLPKNKRPSWNLTSQLCMQNSILSTFVRL
jgi:hypothetical protein